MHTRSIRLAMSLFLAWLASSACSGLPVLGVKRSGLERVDELITHVERVQLDSIDGKGKALTAIDTLRVLLGPEFRGDPAEAHAQFVSDVAQSREQARALRDGVEPLRKAGEKFFARWAADLESFGNLAMRQRSQERLEETRRLYDVIRAAALSAQLAFDAYNGDLSDRALFLRHDFNASSVGLMAQDLEELKARHRELAKRLDACAAACQAYVDLATPSASAGAEPSEAEAPASPPPAKNPAPKKKPATTTTSRSR